MTVSSKDKVIKAAIKIFSRHGFDRASMREIAEEAGLTKPMIYYHFKNKNDLYLHLFKIHLEPFCLRLQKILAFQADYQEVFAQVIDLYEQTFRKNPGMFQIIQREITGGGHFVGLLTEQYFSKIHAQITVFLKKGAQQGVLRPARNYHLCSLTLVAILMFHFSQSSVLKELAKYFGSPNFSRAAIHSHIFNLFIR